MLEPIQSFIATDKEGLMPSSLLASSLVSDAPSASTTDEVFEPMQHPGHLVRRLHQICVAVFLDAAKAYQLTPVQFATLLGIERFPGIDQTRVAKLVALDRQTTSNVVTRLQENGLIERMRKDKRTNALYITGAGRALVEVMQSRIGSVDDTILGPLDLQERQTLMALLQKLVSGNNALSRAPHEPDAGQPAVLARERDPSPKPSISAAASPLRRRPSETRRA